MEPGTWDELMDTESSPMFKAKPTKEIGLTTCGMDLVKWFKSME